MNTAIIHSYSTPWTSSSIPNRVIPPPALVQLAKGPEYDVEAILGPKIIRNKLYYLVDWLGYTSEDLTLEPTTNVTNASKVIHEFHRRYPHKPKPSSCIVTHGTCRQRRGRCHGMSM